MPQLTAGRWSDDTETIYELTSELAAQFQIDPRHQPDRTQPGRVRSLGVGRRLPGFFSRVAPLSGAVFPTEENLSALSQTEVWAFVGSADTVIEPAYTLDFAQQLGNTHTSLTVTVLEGADHFDVPCLAYLGESHDLLQWLIQ